MTILIINNQKIKNKEENHIQIFKNDVSLLRQRHYKWTSKWVLTKERFFEKWWNINTTMIIHK